MSGGSKRFGRYTPPPSFSRSSKYKTKNARRPVQYRHESILVYFYIIKYGAPTPPEVKNYYNFTGVLFHRLNNG